MSMTRNGIVYELIKSPYIITLNGLTFYFSSKNHLEKFSELYMENREVLRYSLYKRFKIYMKLNNLYDIVLYKKIETRGFLIQTEKEIFTCLEQVVLDGVKRIEKK